jgi:hypothetical protein
MTHVLLVNRGAYKLIQGATPEQRQVLTEHRTKTLMEERHLLLIGVGVVRAVLIEVVELLAILVHTTRILLQVQELLKLASHQAHGNRCGTQPMAPGGRPE